MESEFEYLDMVVIHQLKDLLGHRFDFLLDTYLSDCEQRMERLLAAMAAQDYVTVAEQSHGIKGSNLNLGCSALVDICRDIEESAREGDLAHMEQKISSLQQVFAATCREIRAIRR